MAEAPHPPARWRSNQSTIRSKYSARYMCLPAGWCTRNPSGCPAASYTGATASFSRSTPSHGVSSSSVGATIMKGRGAMQAPTMSGWSKYRSMWGM